MTESADAISIIVPTRNEAENIEPLMAGICSTGIHLHEILFVDDASTDATRTIIDSLRGTHRVRLIEQDPTERGLAAAIIAGAKAATTDVVLVMDADLSHPPDRIADLLAPIQAGTADMVIGSRYTEGGSTPAWPRWRKVMSRLGSALAYPLTGVHDSMSGFFAIRRAQLLQIAPASIGFKIAFEIILRGRAHLRICEIPIAFHDRVRGKSKMSFGIAVRFFYQWLGAVFRRILR